VWERLIITAYRRRQKVSELVNAILDHELPDHLAGKDAASGA
jgi:hypothetical protein